MAYERLSDEESRDRVAAIIAAAESLAGDEVRLERPARSAGEPSRKAANRLGPTPSPYRRWALAIGSAALTLGGLVIWTSATEGVSVDQSEPPQVLLASDLGTTETTIATVPGSPGSTVPGSTETTIATVTTVATDTSVTTVGDSTTVAPAITVPPATTAGGSTPTTTVAPATTAPPATNAPATTVPAPTTTVPTPTTTVVATEGPHSRTSPEVESFTSYAGGGMTLIGRVPDQATLDLVHARASEFLPVSVVDNYLQVDPSAKPPIPLFELPSEFIFEGDTATIRLEFSPQIIQMATTLKNRPSTSIDIYVHTDDHADAAFTMEQTRQQAEALKSILIAQGVDASRIHLFPKGSTELLGDSSTYDGWLLNRRVELVVNGLYA